MNITVVLGTARTERKSALVHKVLVDLLSKETNHIVTPVDVKDHLQYAVTLPPWGKGGADEITTKWKEIAINTDVFVFILPEYNHGYPGEWKLLIDSLGTKEYSGKSAFLVGVSSGQFGGARVLDHVQPVLHEIGMILRSPALYISNVNKIFDENGLLVDTATADRMEKFVVALK